MDSILYDYVRPGSDATADDFKTWLRQASVGDSFVYHCGFLALGTNHLGAVLHHAERQRLAAVAHCAWLTAQQGHVHLLQRRLRENCFDYFAVARSRRPDR